MRMEEDPDAGSSANTKYSSSQQESATSKQLMKKSHEMQIHLLITAFEKQLEKAFEQYGGQTNQIMFFCEPLSSKKEMKYTISNNDPFFGIQTKHMGGKEFLSRIKILLERCESIRSILGPQFISACNDAICSKRFEAKKYLSPAQQDNLPDIEESGDERVEGLDELVAVKPGLNAVPGEPVQSPVEELVAQEMQNDEQSQAPPKNGRSISFSDSFSTGRRLSTTAEQAANQGSSSSSEVVSPIEEQITEHQSPDERGESSTPHLVNGNARGSEGSMIEEAEIRNEMSMEWTTHDDKSTDDETPMMSKPVEHKKKKLTKKLRVQPKRSRSSVRNGQSSSSHQIALEPASGLIDPVEAKPQSSVHQNQAERVAPQTPRVSDPRKLNKSLDATVEKLLRKREQKNGNENLKENKDAKQQDPKSSSRKDDAPTSSNASVNHAATVDPIDPVNPVYPVDPVDLIPPVAPIVTVALIPPLAPIASIARKGQAKDDRVKISELYRLNNQMARQEIMEPAHEIVQSELDFPKVSFYPWKTTSLLQEHATLTDEEIYGDRYEEFFEDKVDKNVFDEMKRYLKLRRQYLRCGSYPTGEIQAANLPNCGDYKIISDVAHYANGDVEQLFPSDVEESIMTQNFKNLKLGMLVWCKFDKSYWPATIIGFGQSDKNKNGFQPIRLSKAFLDEVRAKKNLYNMKEVYQLPKKSADVPRKFADVEQDEDGAGPSETRQERLAREAARKTRSNNTNKNTKLCAVDEPAGEPDDHEDFPVEYHRDLIIQVRFDSGDYSYHKIDDIERFDVLFYSRYDSIKRDRNYQEAVARAILRHNGIGFFEDYISSKVVNILMARRGDNFDYLPPFTKTKLLISGQATTIPDPLTLQEIRFKLYVLANKREFGFDGILAIEKNDIYLHRLPICKLTPKMLDQEAKAQFAANADLYFYLDFLDANRDFSVTTYRVFWPSPLVRQLILQCVEDAYEENFYDKDSKLVPKTKSACCRIGEKTRKYPHLHHQSKIGIPVRKRTNSYKLEENKRTLPLAVKLCLKKKIALPDYLLNEAWLTDQEVLAAIEVHKDSKPPVTGEPVENAETVEKTEEDGIEQINGVRPAEVVNGQIESVSDEGAEYAEKNREEALAGCSNESQSAMKTEETAQFKKGEEAKQAEKETSRSKHPEKRRLSPNTERAQKRGRPSNPQ